MTCMNCELDCHVNCIGKGCLKHRNWLCDKCFSRLYNDELPFKETFIDFKCSMSKGFKIAHLNVCSLRHKVDHVRILLNENDIDILCLTETWLDRNINDSDIKIDGYKISRLDKSYRYGTWWYFMLC